MSTFNVIARQDEISEKIRNKIVKNLVESNYTLDEIKPNTVFVVGGDGTFLKAIHDYISDLESIQFIGIHTGTLGFICDHQKEDVDEVLTMFKNETATIQAYPLIEVSDDFSKQIMYAFNEIRVENMIHTQILDIYVNDTYFECFRGSGICICTQMGSTAVNRSLGGAVIQHGLNLLQMSEITGIHHKEYRSLGSSIIFNEDVKIRMKSKSFEESLLCFDQQHIKLDHAHEVTCQLSNKKVRIARYKSYDYLYRVKNLF